MSNKFCVVTDFGVGDCILTTVAIRNLRKKYPDKKIYVASVYDFVYKNSPHIEKVYKLGTPEVMEFYKEHVRGCDFNEVVNIKWYERNYHTKYDGPMSKAACDQLNVEFDEDTPELWLTDEEKEFARNFISGFQKPIVLLQTNASNVQGAGNQMTNMKDWVNNYWDELVILGRANYDFVQIGGKGEYQVKNTALNLCEQTNWRQSLAIASECHTAICIDSFLQHALVAFGKQAIVLFGRSNPKILGHESNINVFNKDSCPDIFCGRPEGGFGDMEIRNGCFTHWQCPHRNCMSAIKPGDVYAQLKALTKRELNKYI